MVKDHSDSVPLEKEKIIQKPSNLNFVNNKEGRKELFYLTTQSTHFIYGYMASDIW